RSGRNDLPARPDGVRPRRVPRRAIRPVARPPPPDPVSLVMADVSALNALPPAEARAAFLRCCGSTPWADAMTARRPFASADGLFATAAEVWAGLGRADWLEAFAAHPRIGDLDSLRQKFAATAAWCAGEQAGVAGADEAVLQGLADGNRRYEERFGYIFIVCATGKSAAELLALLTARLADDPATELRVAAAEQAKITRLRLEKLGARAGSAPTPSTRPAAGRPRGSRSCWKSPARTAAGGNWAGA